MVDINDLSVILFVKKLTLSSVQQQTTCWYSSTTDRGPCKARELNALEPLQKPSAHTIQVPSLPGPSSILESPLLYSAR